MRRAGGLLTPGNPRYLDADPRGSIVLSTDMAGTSAVINTYDEYGIPGNSNQGRFQHTGQAWLGETGMYYNNARIWMPLVSAFSYIRLC